MATFEDDIEEITIVRGSGGVFEVDVDGRRVYSKRSTGRHSQPGEIAALVRELAS